MIYTIRQILALLKNHLKYRKYSIFKCSFLMIFSQHIMMETLRPEEVKTKNDIRNLFRLKKELNYTTIKYGDRNKTLSVEECLNKIRPFLNYS